MHFSVVDLAFSFHQESHAVLASLFWSLPFVARDQTSVVVSSLLWLTTELSRMGMEDVQKCALTGTAGKCTTKINRRRDGTRLDHLVASASAVGVGHTVCRL